VLKGIVVSNLKNQAQSVRPYFSALSRVILELSVERADEMALALVEAYDRRKTVFIFGNGGSASLASHFACDLGKGTSDPKSERKRLRVLALTDNIPTMTAWANDSSYDDIFSEQLKNLVQPGDIAFAISCSGNSPNVLKALRVAREMGATTIGLGGFQGGKMKGLCDICLVVPSDNMQIIEDLHLSVTHAVFTIVKNRISMASDTKALAVGGPP
jgi:D-sedoheptulose 7-phosphate isomerase